jgi:head-tail adaptor
MSFDSLLIHTCTVSRYTSDSQDAYGQPVKTWTDIYTDEPCRLTMTKGREIKQGLEVVISDYKLFISDSLTITERDRVVVSGGTYEVLLVQSRASETDSHHLELALQRVS